MYTIDVLVTTTEMDANTTPDGWGPYVVRLARHDSDEPP